MTDFGWVLTAGVIVGFALGAAFVAILWWLYENDHTDA